MDILIGGLVSALLAIIGYIAGVRKNNSEARKNDAEANKKIALRLIQKQKKLNCLIELIKFW